MTAKQFHTPAMDGLGYDYSLVVDGEEQHFPFALYMYRTREDALAAAWEQARTLTKDQRKAEVLILTARRMEESPSPDEATLIEHHRGPFAD